MIWEPFLLALVLGLIVSSGLYFAYLWPQVAPDDDHDDQRGGERDADGAPRAPADTASPSAAAREPAAADPASPAS